MAFERYAAELDALRVLLEEGLNSERLTEEEAFAELGETLAAMFPSLAAEARSL